MLPRAEMLLKHNFSTVLIDLQAHGESSGEIITLGHLEKHDVLAAVEFAKQHHPNEKVAVIGCSLGGAAAILAGPIQIDALIVEAVYSNINQAIENRVNAKLGVLSTIPSWLLQSQLKLRLGISTDALCPIEMINQVDCPILIISGTHDKHTLVQETQQMYDAAREPKELWLIENAAHVDLFSQQPEQYESRTIDFLDRFFRE